MHSLSYFGHLQSAQLSFLHPSHVNPHSLFRILIYVQTQNCIRNETTLERYGSVADRTVSSASKGQSLVQSRANSSASLVDDREGQIARTMTERTEF